jgi:hypothetical protein
MWSDWLCAVGEVKHIDLSAEAQSPGALVPAATNVRFPPVADIHRGGDLSRHDDYGAI